MKKGNLKSIFGVLFIFFNLSAQHIAKAPDSLNRYNYLELNKKINQNRRTDVLKNRIYAMTCLLRAKEEDNPEEIIYGYNMVGLVYGLNDIDLELKYSDSAIAVARNRLPTKLPYTYFRRGQIYSDYKMLKQALNCFLTANKYATTSIDLNTRINYSIGLIKNTQGNYEEALPIYEKCEKIGRENNFSNYIVYLFGLSELYNRMDKIQLSEEFTNKGLLLCKKDKLGGYYYSYFISNKGKNHFKRKKYNEAIQDLKSQLKTISNNGDYSNVAENSFYIGESYRMLKNDERATEYYKKVDSIFKAKKDIYPINISAYEHLISYYKKKQDYKNVIYYSDQFIKADKVIDENYKYITSKIAKTYDIQKITNSKEAIILSLNKNKKMTFFTIIILSLCIIMLIFFLYYNNLRKQKEINRQKELFNTFRFEREQKRELLKSTITIDNAENIKKTITVNIDENVINYILNCLDQFEKEQWYINKEYSVEMLATEFKTNSSYLSRVINEIKGCTFTQYINKMRIDFILEKLDTDKKTLNYTVQALSEMAGYNSVQTFTRAFTGHTKMKASEYVKKLSESKL